MPVQIAPSVLSADFARLADAAAAVEGAADWLHVDVMDNHFVPNLTVGRPVVAALHKATALPLDCHLMIDNPDRWASGYAEAGARNVTFHAEAAHDVVQTARAIRAAGARAGLGLKPATAFDDYRDVLSEFDMLLVMTVEPGFGGQEFMADVLSKVVQARRFLRDTGAQLWIQVDGGIAPDTIEMCARAGADMFVAGSAVYGAHDPAKAVAALRERAQAATPIVTAGDRQPD
jgi:ribulose-phosphate 3-epimerase